MGVHATTHIDAPWHYAPTCEGQPAKTIDEVPLDWCFGEGIVIDMKHKPDFEAITSADIQAFLQKNDLELKPKMIVLIKTRKDNHTWGQNSFSPMARA
ncbi:MAG: cyclase family protein [Saprospiraceae bacterium]